MFNVTILLINSTSQFLLGYNTHSGAYDARESYKKRKEENMEFIVLKDDFGMELQLPITDIQAFVVEDLDKALDSRRERDIAQRQEQARFMKRRQDNIELMHLYPVQGPQGGFQNAG